MKFKKGNTPHNKGKALEDYLNPDAIEKIQETQFKEGVHTGEKSLSWKGGVQKPKNDCVHLWSSTGARMRRPRQIYEERFGAIPKGYVIYHKNRIKHDDTPENLEAISRAELLKRNREERNTAKNDQ